MQSSEQNEEMRGESSITTVADIPRVQARRKPEEAAIVFEGRETSYAQLNVRASQVANGLLTEGLKPQARVAVLDKSSDSFFEVLFGAAKAGCVLVPFNWRLSQSEIAYVMNDSEAEVLFVGPEFFALIEKLIGHSPRLKRVVVLGGVHELWETYDEWRDRQSHCDPMTEIEMSQVALQMYTSGTTGRPKGAQLTHSNLLTLLPTALAEWGAWTDDEVNMVCLPLFHIGGTGWALMGLYSGAKTIVMRDAAPAQMLRLVSEQRVTRMFVVPALILFLLQTPGVEEADFSSVKQILYGASPMPVELLRRAMRTLECPFAQVYGLTETTGGITYLPPEDHDPLGGGRVRSCGKPPSTVELRIVDAAGEELPIGEVGEIVCRGRQNMKGYWNLPEETAQTIRGQWLHTGDAGYLDADGYLYIHDRVKDMIVSGGENIYPAEVENVLFSHPAIADVAVIGAPDEVWGESVKAVVVKNCDSDVTEAEIIAFARERIAHYKAPKSVDFVESLPRNPSGKILKRELRAPYWAGRDRQVN